MRITLVSLVICLFATALQAAPVGVDLARTAAQHQLQRAGADASSLTLHTTLQSANGPLGYVFTMQPVGFVVASADTDLPPVIAYSASSAFTGAHTHDFTALLITDLTYRQQALPLLPARMASQRNEAWNELLQGSRGRRFTQWPPEGSTPTGGWVPTRWSQGNPYNMFCPLDLGTNTRAVAGCPSVAMAQIAAYWQSTNNTHLNDDDDYYHAYGGQNYTIDDDAATYGFPTFPQLNDYLDAATTHMRYGQALSDEDNAALVFACGVAAHQVYNPGGSGTFGVDQAMTAYERFGFEDAVLLTDDSLNVYERMAQNIRDAMPVHLAVVNSDWTSGHNVVADGWNTDGYFHLNMGWGGTYDNWYLLPDEFPYSLTVLEGVVVDLAPLHYAFASPDTLAFLTQEQCNEPQQVTIFNMHSDSLVVEDILYDESAVFPCNLSVDAPELPYTILPGQSFSFDVWVQIPIGGARDTISTTIRTVFDLGFAETTVLFNDEITGDVNDDAAAWAGVSLRNSPNPFNPETTIRFALPQPADAKLSVYNLRGQRVRTLLHGPLPAGAQAIVWDGRDDTGGAVASGLYLYRLTAGSHTFAGKMLMLK